MAYDNTLRLQPLLKYFAQKHAIVLLYLQLSVTINQKN